MMRTARSAAQSPLQLGILPHVSARMLLVNYQPLRSHLARQLERPVEVVTAPGFPEFHARSIEGRYDVLLTAANLGRVAELDGRLVPISILEPSIPGLLAMLQDRPVTSVDALRGRTLAMANPASLVALKGLAWLRGRGVEAGKDFRIAHAANEDSLGQLLNSGEAPLAMMSAGEFRAVPDALRARLAVFTEFVRVPGFMTMHRPGLSADDAGQVRAALAGFMASEDGVTFTRLTGNHALRAIRADDLEVLADVLDETQRLLG